MTTVDALPTEELTKFVGLAGGPPRMSLDPVNSAMIRHWCTALGDTNSRYASGPDQIAPPAMLQAWCMPGLAHAPDPEMQPTGDEPSVSEALATLLVDAGYRGVVATDCEQTYHRDVSVGETLVEERIIEAISEQKQTALGPGFFITMRMTYLDEAGETVATMRFRTLRYAPAAPSEPGTPDRRPRPVVTDDTRFFFEGVDRGELLIQQCRGCDSLIHPPTPHCPRCGSFDQGHATMSGRATVHSFVINHHPKAIGFDYPLVVAVVELDEGPRLVTNLVDVDLDAVSIGLDVEVRFVAVDDELTLPMFTASTKGP